jgi:hypothetical protein
MNRPVVVLLVLILLSAPSARADVMVTIGEYPMTANQTPIYVSGDELLMAMTFNFQIGSGDGTWPRIESVDFVTGTIWAAQPPTVVTRVQTSAQFVSRGVDAPYEMQDPLASAVVAGDGYGHRALLATVTINPGPVVAADANFTLSVTDTLLDASSLIVAPWTWWDQWDPDDPHYGTPAPLPYEAVMHSLNGSLIPEPMSLSLLGLGALGLLRRRR